MKSKYLMGRFGVCPRVLCERQNVLPVGMSYELRTSRVKVYILKNYKKINIIDILSQMLRCIYTQKKNE